MSSSNINALAARVAALEQRIFTATSTSGPNAPSVYQIYPSQQATQWIRYDLYNFIFSSNTPGAGQVSWSPGFLIYQGITYPIAAGSTTHTYIYWQKSNPYLFQSASGGGLPTLGVDDYVIALSSPLGSFELVIDQHNVLNERVLIAGSGIWGLDATGHVIWQLQRDPGTSGAASFGTLILNSSAGNLPINMNPNGDGEIFSNHPYTAVTNSTGQTIPNNVQTLLTFDTLLQDSSQSFITVPSSTFTAPADGMYLVYGLLTFSPNATGTRQLLVKDLTTLNVYLGSSLPAAPAAHGTCVNLAIVLQLSKGSQWQFYGYQDSGGPLNTLGGKTITNCGFNYLCSF